MIALRRVVQSVPFLLVCCAIFLVGTPRSTQGLVQEQSSNASEAPPSPSQELAHESREAAGENGAAQFRHSAAVRWVSRVTGLGLEPSYLITMGINFLIVVGVVVWLSKKSLPAFFRNRTASIQKAMEEARQASADANRRLAEIETRLSRIDGEIAEMRAVAEKETMDEEQRIKASAEDDAQKIADSVGQEITAAVRNARRELTTYAADLAVALARKQIHVDGATDQNIVRDFARQLSNRDLQKRA